MNNKIRALHCSTFKFVTKQKKQKKNPVFTVCQNCGTELCYYQCLFVEKYMYICTQTKAYTGRNETQAFRRLKAEFWCVVFKRNHQKTLIIMSPTLYQPHANFH